MCSCRISDNVNVLIFPLRLLPSGKFYDEDFLPRLLAIHGPSIFVILFTQTLFESINLGSFKYNSGPTFEIRIKKIFLSNIILNQYNPPSSIYALSLYST